MERLSKILNELYEKYNRRDFVSPDPLQFLYHYTSPMNIELAGLISSSFAFGNVKNILNFLEKIFYIITPPYQFLLNTSEKEIFKIFKKFKYRFADGQEISSFFIGIKRFLNIHTSLYNFFYSEYINKKSLISALKSFLTEMHNLTSKKIKILLPNPENNSAFKRVFLFLRWMIRRDDVDIGIWENISPKDLIIPVDTHMLKIAKYLKFTKRKTSDLKTAIEITNKFKQISPDDPVKYDFILTRFGIHPKFNLKEVSHGLSTMGNTWN